MHVFALLRGASVYAEAARFLSHVRPQELAVQMRSAYPRFRSYNTRRLVN